MRRVLYRCVTGFSLPPCSLKAAALLAQQEESTADAHTYTRTPLLCVCVKIRVSGRKCCQSLVGKN